ncbi:MAG TPA: holin [Rhodoglobus sp.]|nr:holin [Rhodoglobus sp.]
MSVLTTGKFWAATVERAVSTAAQSAIGVLTANTTGVAEIDWAAGLTVVGVATALSVLKAVAAVNLGEPGPGIGSAEALTDKAV